MTKRIARNVSGYYTLIAAAKYMGVTRTMMYYWHKKGLVKIRIHTISGKGYLLKDDLDKLKAKLDM